MRKDFDSLLKILTLSAMAKLHINYETVVDQIPDWYSGAVSFIQTGVQTKGLRINKEMATSLANVAKRLKYSASGSKVKYKRIAEDVQNLGEWLELNRKLGNWSRMSELATDKTAYK
jgi:hypothetical protein